MKINQHKQTGTERNKTKKKFQTIVWWEKKESRSFVFLFHLFHSQFREEDTISMCSESSMLFSSYDQRMMRANVNSEPSYPSQWSIEDVGKWLNEIALQAYVENFRRHDIDGSILIDETDGINDDIIRQLIPSLGTQLKFKKALRALRK